MPKETEIQWNSQEANDILVKVNDFLELGKSGHVEDRMRMEKNFRYVNGDQWEPQVRDWNEKRGKLLPRYH